MAARTRTRIRRKGQSGKWQYIKTATKAPIVTTNNSVFTTAYQSNADTTMSPPYDVDHTLDIQTWDNDGFCLNGECIYDPLILGGSQSYKFTNTSWQGRSLYANNLSVSVIDANYWKTRALANLNPNRPTLDVPLFLFELKDFPRMLRQLGDFLRLLIQKDRIDLTRFPDWFLGYSFGWAPLIQDVTTLFGLARDIENRKRYLKNLERGGRVKRSLFRGPLQDYVLADGMSLFPIFNNGVPGFTHAYKADRHVRETGRIWFSANAKLTTPLPPNSDLETLSTDLVLGLQIRPDLVWNMIPWSWLIDYFTNIGDVMETYDGLVGYQVSRMCLMVEQSLTDFPERIRTAPGVTESYGNVNRTVRKRRFVYPYPTPSVTLTPFLTGGQVANLGALLLSAFLSQGR
jgi:hypothetical protein